MRVGRVGPTDLDALIALETAAFTGDRLSRRSFCRLLAAPNALWSALRSGPDLVGYALALSRRDSLIVRLYSIAVADHCRGHGGGGRLLKDIERQARASGAAGLRLEVSVANHRALRLYRGLGYLPFTRLAGYYADGSDALRLERRWRVDGAAARREKSVH